MTTLPNVTDLQLALLRAVKKAPKEESYGIALCYKAIIDIKSRNQTPGTAFNGLTALIARGMLTSEREAKPSGRGRPKVHYFLTTLGRDVILANAKRTYKEPK